jgi:hypothetical protein
VGGMGIFKPFMGYDYYIRVLYGLEENWILYSYRQHEKIEIYLLAFVERR